MTPTPHRPAPAPIITGPGTYQTREGKRVEIVSGIPLCDYPWESTHGHTYADSGRCNLHRESTADIVSRIDSPPQSTRLAKAKAALEVETKQHWHALQLLNAAIAERDAAEREAAATRALPPALVEVAREVGDYERKFGPHAHWEPGEVLAILAQSYSIPVSTLRAAIGGES